MQRTATLLALLLLAAPALAQPTSMRQDAVWARTSATPITLDGTLNEAAWSTAQTITLVYGSRAGDPGSGYKSEGGLDVPTDPTRATVRFLVHDGQLYLGAEVQDNSIGGSREFNRKDGFLMSIMNGIVPTTGGAGFSEYFYSWWYPNLPAGEPIPAQPGFIGRYGNFDNPQSRTAAQIARWDARTVVNGTPNDDSGNPDTGYTVEMRFDLQELGYDLTQPTQVPFSISVYDVDGFFPFNDATFSSKRVWWQNAFNGPVQNYGRLFVDPAVTTASGALPGMPYDLVVPNGANVPDPTINGRLDEAVWARLPGIPIRFVTGEMDAEGLAVRRAYPGIGPFASAQFQPDFGRDRAPVLDPARATVKWFFKGDRLYVGVDVDDQVVTADETGEDRWDGFRLSLNDRTALQPDDRFLLPRTFAVRVGPTGAAVAAEGLTELLAADPARAAVALALKSGSTVNNPSDVDAGYQIEMMLDLTALGYPAGRGDGLFFVGATLFDYDALEDPLASYGTRAWFFRERAGASAAYAYFDPNTLVSTSSEGGPGERGAFRLLGAFPNPFSPGTVVRYETAEAGRASLEVFDVLGRRVARVEAGAQAAGENAIRFEAERLPSGTYLYRVQLETASGVVSSPAGRFVLVR